MDISRFLNRLTNRFTAMLVAAAATFGAAGTAFAAPTEEGAQPTADLLASAQPYIPSSVCNPDVTANYTVRQSNEYSRGHTVENFEGVVTCAVAPEHQNTLRGAVGYTDPGTQDVPVYYIVPSAFNQQKEPVAPQRAAGILQNTLGVPAGLYVAKDGTMAVVGTGVPQPDAAVAPVISRVLANADAAPPARRPGQ